MRQPAIMGIIGQPSHVCHPTTARAVALICLVLVSVVPSFSATPIHVYRGDHERWTLLSDKASNGSDSITTRYSSIVYDEPIIQFLPHLMIQYNGAEYEDIVDVHRLATSLNSTSSNATATANVPAPPINIAALTVSMDEFRRAVQACGFPEPSLTAYTGFLIAADPGHHAATIKLPSKIDTRRELAMFLAHVLHESDGLRARREYACAANGCPGAYSTPGLDVPGRYYYGRGYIQLTWAANYRDASRDMFGDERVLLEDPDRVANQDDLLWYSSIWFWHARGVHDAAATGEFGQTTKIINGGLECGGGWNQGAAKKRFGMYQTVATMWGVGASELVEAGCY